jgi:hypothetical protein
MKTSTLILAAFLILAPTVSWASNAREAWQGLVAPRFAHNPAFAWVENDPTLPNVLIYGDSISIAFTPRVRENLAGQANVHRLHHNGSDSSTFITQMERLHSTMRNPALADPWSFDWDIIQFNVGLHDLKYMANGKLDTANGTQVSSVEQYATNLRQIIAYLKETAPQAKLVFATTTPVPENSNGRVAGDAAIYNRAARMVLRDHPEIVVNDLYRLTKPNQREWWVRPGDVHFNPTGIQAQGDEVARVIRALLSP